MKRFWIACFAVAAAATTMVGNVNAQWSQSPEIGSYQSILSRTGYGSPVGGTVGTVPGALPGQLVNVSPQAVAPVTPVGSATRQSVGSSTRQPAGSNTREVAPVTSYAPQTSYACLLYTSPSPRDATLSRMPSSA